MWPREAGVRCHVTEDGWLGILPSNRKSRPFGGSSAQGKVGAGYRAGWVRLMRAANVGMFIFLATESSSCRCSLT